MLDTAIVGGGLCGLTLARGMREQNRSFAVYEARNRLGGRILSVPSAVVARLSADRLLVLTRYSATDGPAGGRSGLAQLPPA